jgi:hypothetical protein
MDDYELQRTMSLLGLRALPRSLGMITGAITLLVTLNPTYAFAVSIGVWFITYLIKSALSPSIVDTYLWSCLSLPVNLIGAKTIRWVVYITMVIIALVRGAPFMETLGAMGGLLIYDLFIVFTRRA